MSLSPNGAFLAVIDVAGNLSIVEVPSFRSKKFWSFKQLVRCCAMCILYINVLMAIVKISAE